MDKEEVLYHTFSVCPRCAIVERKGALLQPARVVVKNDRVFLIATCRVHDAQETLYCSNVPFMKRMLRWSSLLSRNDTVPQLPDLEDLQRRKSIGATANHFHFPLILELPITEGTEFLADDVIKAQIEKHRAAYPANRKFVLKILAKGAMDIPKLNSKILTLVEVLPHHPVLVEVTYERLVLLSNLRDSVFLKVNVYPALKYYLRRNDEQLCKVEIERLLRHLSTFEGIKAVVTIGIERPFPDLKPILTLLRAKYATIRVVVLSFERGPKEVVATLTEKVQSSQPTTTTTTSTTTSTTTTTTTTTATTTTTTASPDVDEEDRGTHVDVIDPYEVMELVQAATRNEVSADDFHAMSLGSILEPFLRMVGFGLFCIRPSPFCGFGVCLVNTENLQSYPASRLIDFELLYEEMLPLLPDMEDKIGFFTAQKLKKVLRSCAKPHTIVPVPNLYDYLTEKAKADETKRVIDNTQILVVHNNMDLAAFDMVRRCDCAVETNSNRLGFVSACTGCL